MPANTLRSVTDSTVIGMFDRLIKRVAVLQGTVKTSNPCFWCGQEPEWHRGHDSACVMDAPHGFTADRPECSTYLASLGACTNDVDGTRGADFTDAVPCLKPGKFRIIMGGPGSLDYEGYCCDDCSIQIIGSLR